MDNEFYTDSFEQLLKEQADRFSMQPTKRVWHSIYNDLHPARKWPSIAISLLLVISMLLLGYLNTDNNNKRKGTAASDLANNTNNNQGNDNLASKRIAAQPINDNTSSTGSAANGNDVSDGTSESNTDVLATLQNAPTVISIATPTKRLPRRTSRQSSVQAIQGNNRQGSTQAIIVPFNNNGTSQAPTTNSNRSNTIVSTNDNNLAPVSSNNATALVEGKIAPNNADRATTILNGTAGTNNEVVMIASSQTDEVENEEGNSNLLKDNATPTTLTTQNAQQNIAALELLDKAWIDNHAFYNKPSPGKWKNRVSWQVYITPSVTYRTLFENAVGEGRNNLQNLITNPFTRQAGLENSVEHRPGPSLELGGALVYDVAKKWQLRLGTQINYTSYVAMGNQIHHPINTSISVNNLFTGSLDNQSQSASISNTPGSNLSKLNNYTVQLAIPVGFAYKLAGKDDLKFYVGATAQPSFLLAGSSPMLSSDRLFYVDNNTKQGKASYMRKFNLAMGIETFASYRMGGYTFIAGPQLRYQLLNTNSTKYTVGEKLYSIGLKLGIAKRF